jgi:hypothetical protein
MPLAMNSFPYSLRLKTQAMRRNIADITYPPSMHCAPRMYSGH